MDKRQKLDPEARAAKGLNRLKEEIAKELGVYLNITTKPRKNKKKEK